MAIQLACSTAAFPDLTFEQVAERAQQLGYRGLNVCVPGAGDGPLASDPTVATVGAWAEVLARCELAPVCLDTSVVLSGGSSRQAGKAAAQVGGLAALAGEIGCRYVRLLVGRPPAGQTPRTVLQRLAGPVEELAERAADADVTLLFENGGSLRQGALWWHLLNEVDHPLVQMAWHVAAADEAAVVSVPLLSRWLRLAKVCDLSESGRVVPLGEGVVPVKPFVERLLGIGYDGYVVVDWHPSGAAASAPEDAGAYLSGALALIQGWLDETAAGIEKGQAKAAKAAARNQPIPRAELQAK